MAPKSGKFDATDLETMRLATAIVEVMKADSAAKEDLDEEEEEEEEEEEVIEEDTDSCESDQKWDVDSFKDVEFNSDGEVDDEEWRRYVRQCYKSEGFDVAVDFLPKSSTMIYTGFNPVKLDEYFGPPKLTGRAYMEKMVKVIIEKYNESKGKNLVLVDIVRTVVKMADGVKAYITFMARESPDGEPVEYQGKAEKKVWQKNIHPILCRPASEQRKID
ncbi:hypothetical protein AALP_AA1G030800 [Arabis alpina]|uniref:Cystatin domain-containing protein n=1 Tax=Arabis alpina TaxID=50452 RepID=A0A087HKR5_ARAAL|nr:hypothetical protein AALP_AA1G030800 [Arabis alpina]